MKDSRNENTMDSEFEGKSDDPLMRWERKDLRMENQAISSI